MTTDGVEARGMCASPGFARGPLYVLDDEPAAGPRDFGGPASEAALLRAALGRATRELSELADRTANADEHELLEFQIAMLDDQTLTAAPFAAIAAGAPAERAWSDALDGHIDEYRHADDPYFAARATDLVDLRDRVLRVITGASANAVPAGAIVVADDLTPSRFLELSWRGGGIALFGGSTHSHTATLARARGVPMIVGLTPAAPLPPGEVLLDAENGVLIATPTVQAIGAFAARWAAARTAQRSERRFLDAPAVTAEGERVRVMLNVAHIDDLSAVDAGQCDGIGLVRTELMLRTVAELRDEAYQVACYRAIVDWARGRPVTFRTLDAGGDKPIPGFTRSGEANPFLGMRGVRLSLESPDVLRVQLRALARVAAAGDVNIMVPMVTVSAEFDGVRLLLDDAIAQLRAAGTPYGTPALGMMVEVPAAALTIDTFAAEFFSIGSNDLIAYTMAAARDAAGLASLCDPLQPAVLRLIRTVVTAAAQRGRDVSVCGDMGSDACALPALLAAGVRAISVAPAALAKVKAVIGSWSAVPDE
jgi:phosphotransferase system enzyme I (PtsI)